MFRTDKDSLEKISFMLDEKDLTNFKYILNNLKSKNLLSVPNEEYNRVIAGLDSIGKLKLDGKMYGFHISDSYARGSAYEGIALYLRQGDTLEDFFKSDDRYYVKQVDEAIPILKKNNISTIYTGDIYGDHFLGVPSSCDDDDPIFWRALYPEDVEQFESSDIKIIYLDQLI